MLTPRARDQFRTANKLARELHKTLLELGTELRNNGEDMAADRISAAREDASCALQYVEELIDNLPAPQAPDPHYQRAADNGRLILPNGRDVS
jgi:hypothetical protein